MWSNLRKVKDKLVYNPKSPWKIPGLTERIQGITSEKSPNMWKKEGTSEKRASPWVKLRQVCKDVVSLSPNQLLVCSYHTFVSFWLLKFFCFTWKYMLRRNLTFNWWSWSSCHNNYIIDLSYNYLIINISQQVVSSIPHCVRPEWRLQKN